MEGPPAVSHSNGLGDLGLSLLLSVLSSSPHHPLSCSYSRAIRALQDEVWRLRLRLEESLHRSHSYPEGRAPHTPKGRRQAAASRASFLRDAAPVG